MVLMATSAGNTNAEIISITVKRMNTDSLGGNTLAADSELSLSQLISTQQLTGRQNR